MNILLVGLGGGLGAVLRYLLGLLLYPVGLVFPVATLVVNVLGCFLIGFLNSGPLSDSQRVFAMTGVLGGFTTFSAFGLETRLLVAAGRPGLAFLNVGLQLSLGLLACFIGASVRG